MKTRLGFVSNSSSSSFIVKGMKTGEIAKKMVELIEREFQEEWYNPHTCPSCGSKLTGADEPDPTTTCALNFIRENPGFDDPIAIPWSCNYGTFIVRQTEEIVFVETCNNHRWEEVLDYQNVDDGYNANMATNYLDLSCMETKSQQEIEQAIFGEV